MTSWKRQGVDSSPAPLGRCMGTCAWWSPALSWSRCVLHVLWASVSTCRAFSDLVSSCQIAVGFWASVEAGNLEALLRHLSSGESPSQMSVGDDTVFFGCLARVLCSWCFLRACRWTRTQVSNSPRTLNLTIFSGRWLGTDPFCGLLRPSGMRKGST